ncbi:hypothetical protein LTR85_006812 [Meristemomyces frigidus]|nr:hypothetical protein LTR85_006812 [Meristemomyces frigidus]
MTTASQFAELAAKFRAIAIVSSPDVEMPEAPAPVPPPSQSPLLALPGELRNRIYRLALVEPRLVLLNRTKFVEPALLVACHQIRHEAAPIFYGENDFRIPVPNYDSTICKLWTVKVRAVRRKYDIHIETSLSRGTGHEEPNWENAIKWLQRRHSGAVRYQMHKPSSAPKHFTPDMMVLGGMFAMAKELQDKSWSRVKKLMEEQHRILVAIDPRWEAKKAVEAVPTV